MNETKIDKYICLLMLFLFISTFISTFPAYPQNHDYKFEYLTMKDGLSQSSINCILQDSTGFLWFATQMGLNRFDGCEFKVLKHTPFDPNSLSNNWVEVMVETEPGILWLGTWAGGLNRYDTVNETITRFIHSPDNKNSPINNSIRAMFKDSTGSLWIGTKSGLDYLDTKTITFTNYTTNPNDPSSLSHPEITAIYVDNNNTPWIGTANGLNRFNRDTGRFTRFFHHPNDPGSISGNSITAITGDRSGNLWIGTKDSGLNRLPPGQNRFERFLNDPASPDGPCSNIIRSLLIDRSGSLWIGTGSTDTHGNGVSCLSIDDRNSKWTHYAYKSQRLSAASSPTPYLNDNTILSIYEDRTGSLWFGTFQNGINKLNKRRAKFHHYFHDPDNPGDLSDNAILSFDEDAKGNLWIGTFAGGLNRFDLKTRGFTHYKYAPGIPGNTGIFTIWDIFIDKSGLLWLGTGGSGIILFNPETAVFKLFSGDDDPFRKTGSTISFIKEDSAGNLWLGAWDNGLFMLDRKTKQFHHYTMDPASATAENVICIHEDKDKILWLGTFGQGLVKAVPSAGDDRKPVTLHLQPYRHDDKDKKSISSDYMDFLTETEINGKEYLWIGTTYGLNRFDKETGTFTSFSESDGLGNNMIYGIVPAGEYLWLSTNAGISQFNTRTLTFNNYDTGDGVQSMEFNTGACIKTGTGEIFLGGVNGFNAFFPGSVPRNPNIPPIVITRISTFDTPVSFPKAVHAMDRVELSYKDRFFSFEFAALDFENPGKNRYAYKLEGFNDDWIQCGSRRYVSFSNLTGGEFVFRVKGSNNDGIWNETGAAVRISIQPPFFQTGWFKAAATALVIFLFLLLLHLRTRRLKHKMDKDHLEDQLKLKTDFTAMLVHDLRNPLQCIIGYSDLLADEIEDPNARNFNRRIRQSSNTMLQLINDMLDISKFEAGKMVIHPENIRLIDMIEENIRLMEPLLEYKHNVFKSHLEPLPPIDADPVRISQVINNLLANALKFSPENGVITITARTVCEDDNEFQEITISDEGPGIPPEKQASLFSQYAQIKSREKIKGTGLGLAVSRLIIEAHKGTIGFRQPGPHGSIFFFTLPGKKSG